MLVSVKILTCDVYLHLMTSLATPLSSAFQQKRRKQRWFSLKLLYHTFLKNYISFYCKGRLFSRNYFCASRCRQQCAALYSCVGTIHTAGRCCLRAVLSGCAISVPTPMRLDTARSGTVVSAQCLAKAMLTNSRFFADFVNFWPNFRYKSARLSQFFCQSWQKTKKVSILSTFLPENVDKIDRIAIFSQL